MSKPRIYLPMRKGGVILNPRFFGGVHTLFRKTDPFRANKLAAEWKTKKGLPCANTTSPDHKMLEASNG